MNGLLGARTRVCGFHEIATAFLTNPGVWCFSNHMVVSVVPEAPESQTFGDFLKPYIPTETNSLKLSFSILHFLQIPKWPSYSWSLCTSTSHLHAKITSSHLKITQISLTKLFAESSSWVLNSLCFLPLDREQTVMMGLPCPSPENLQQVKSVIKFYGPNIWLLL